MAPRLAPQLLLGVVLTTAVHCGGSPQPAAPTAPPRQVVDTEAKPEPAKAKAKSGLEADDEDDDQSESPPPAADPLEGLIAKLGTERLHSESPIRAATFSPDGQELLTGGRPGMVERWRVPTGERLDPLPLPGGPETWAQRLLAPAGARHVIAIVDGKAVVYSWPDRKLEGTVVLSSAGYLSNHRTPVAASRTRIAALTDDGIVVKELSGLTQAARIQPGAGTPAALALSQDGRRLAAATGTGIQVWELASTKRLLQTSSGKERCTEVALSPDGKLVAAVCKDDVLRWDLDTGQLVARDTVGFVRTAHALAFSADGSTLYARETTFEGPPTVRRFAARTKKQIEDLPGTGMAPHPSDGAKLALVRSHGLVICSAHGQACKPPEAGHTAAVGHLSWSRARRTLVSSASDGTVIRWQLSAAAATGALAHQDHVLISQPVVVSDAGWLGLVVSTKKQHWRGRGQALRVMGLDRLDTRWETATGSYAEPLLALAASSDGSRLLAADEQGDVELWSAKKGKRALRLPLGEPEPEHYSLSDDRQPRTAHLAPAGTALVVMDPRSGTALWRLPRGTQVAATDLGSAPCAVDRTGHLVVCTSGGDLKLRPLDGSTPTKTIATGLETIHHLAITTNPPRIAAAGTTDRGDRELRILDPTTAHPLLEASTDHLSPITALTLIANAQRLITAHQNGWLQIWPGHSPGDGASL